MVERQCVKDGATVTDDLSLISKQRPLRVKPFQRRIQTNCVTGITDVQKYYVTIWDVKGSLD